MSTDDDVLISFGKWKGYPLHLIDLEYLIWIRDKTDMDVTKPRLYQAVLNEIWRRTRFRQAKPQARPQPPVIPWRDILATCRRRQAIQWHPDRGGDLRIMQAINSTIDQLERDFERISA